jgi:Stage II sporulation protein
MFAAAAVLVPVSAAAAAAPHAVAVSGQVLDARVLSTPRGASVVIPNGLRPIAGARVSVAFPSGTTVNAVTNRAGWFTVARPAGTPSKAAALVSVSASAFGTWREKGVPVALPHDNHPVLTVLLRASAQSQAYPRNLTITGRLGPGSGRGSGKPAPTPSASARAKSAQNSAGSTTPAGGCTGFFSNTTPPATIQVYNVNTGTIQTYAFEYYVENVLPNEWISSWPASSLEAGAMAVKTYGWYWVNNWRGGSLNGTCYDVEGGTYSDGACDVNYQCFIPGSAVAATTDAVENTWTAVAQQSGAVFEASFNSGYSSDTCGEDDGSPAPGDEMSQWGTQACADDGYGWQQIFTTYYFPDVAFLAGTGPLEVAFQASTGDLYMYDPATNASQSVNLGMAEYTSPAIVDLPGGGFEVAFQANTGDLYMYDPQNNSSYNTHLGMAAETSPAIAASPDGGEEVAFQANTGDLYTYDPANNSNVNAGLGMEAGTSPAIAAAATGGYEVAFEANSGDLYTYDPANNSSLNVNLGMAIGTSPAIAASPDGGYEVAFQANTGDLYTYDPQNNSSGSANLGMAVGTSPAIAADTAGDYEVAFQANTGHLYTYNPQNNSSVNANLGVELDTDPSIAASPGGGYEVAFQANTEDLYTYDPQNNSSGSVNLGMAVSTSPAIS